MTDQIDAQHFLAFLPQLATPIRIESLYDARIFTRRWVIRNKDRTLKVLLKQLEKANCASTSDLAMRDFRKALRTHGLVPDAGGGIA